MQTEKNEADRIVMLVMRALQRARISILTVALTYIVAVSAGMIMVHSGNEGAIAYRDRIVSGAQSSTITNALHQNNRFRAAFLDFGGNLYVGIANTLGGLGIIVPFPMIAYRGWIGGIVSIDGAHASRLADPREAAYYLITLLLQLIPSTLAAGAGVNMGLAYFKPRSFYQGEKWFGIPKEAIRDALRIYVLAVPLFLVASLWEFLAR
jgi:hypothetical protein